MYIMCVCICIYIQIDMHVSISISISISIYIYLCVCVCVYIYICCRGVCSSLLAALYLQQLASSAVSAADATRLGSPNVEVDKAEGGSACFS
jgi:hypothetical protein